MSNYGENMCQAISLIVENYLGNQKYDKTIVCKITDDTYSSEGRYEVQYESSTFTVYSDSKSYRKGTSVWVTVPGGDFNAQKFIVGRYTSSEEDKYVTNNDLSTFINISGNIINSTATVASLLANDTSRSKIILGTYAPQISSSYTYIGLSGEFCARLGALSAIEGDYGLGINLTANYASGNPETATVTLSNKDFFGNPYNFEDYFYFEKLVKVSEVLPLENREIVSIDIEVFVFQNNNFKQKNGNPVIFEDGIGGKLEDNILFRNLNISFGGTEIFPVSDKLIISALNSNYTPTKDASSTPAAIYYEWFYTDLMGAVHCVSNKPNLYSELPPQGVECYLGIKSPTSYGTNYFRSGWDETDMGVLTNSAINVMLSNQQETSTIEWCLIPPMGSTTSSTYYSNELILTNVAMADSNKSDINISLPEMKLFNYSGIMKDAINSNISLQASLIPNKEFPETSLYKVTWYLPKGIVKKPEGQEILPGDILEEDAEFYKLTRDNISFTRNNTQLFRLTENALAKAELNAHNQSNYQPKIQAEIVREVNGQVREQYNTSAVMNLDYVLTSGDYSYYTSDSNWDNDEVKSQYIVFKQTEFEDGMKIIGYSKNQQTVSGAFRQFVLVNNQGSRLSCGIDYNMYLSLETDPAVASTVMSLYTIKDNQGSTKAWDEDTGVTGECLNVANIFSSLSAASELTTQNGGPLVLKVRCVFNTQEDSGPQIVFYVPFLILANKANSYYNLFLDGTNFAYYQSSNLTVDNNNSYKTYESLRNPNVTQTFAMAPDSSVTDPYPANYPTLGTDNKLVLKNTMSKDKMYACVCAKSNDEFLSYLTIICIKGSIASVDVSTKTEIGDYTVYNASLSSGSTTQDGFSGLVIGDVRPSSSGTSTKMGISGFKENQMAYTLTQEGTIEINDTSCLKIKAGGTLHQCAIYAVKNTEGTTINVLGYI